MNAPIAYAAAVMSTQLSTLGVYFSRSSKTRKSLRDLNILCTCVHVPAFPSNYICLKTALPCEACVRTHLSSSFTKVRVEKFVGSHNRQVGALTRPRAYVAVSPSHGRARVGCDWEQHPKIVLDTPAQYRMHLVGEIFCIALNNRFFKISRRNDPPFYNAGTQSEELARPVQVPRLVSCVLRMRLLMPASCARTLESELFRMRYRLVEWTMRCWYYFHD